MRTQSSPGNVRARHLPLPDRTSIDDADRLRSRIEDFVDLVAVYELLSGATFDMLGDDLGISRQSAHRRYAEPLDRFKGALAEAEDGIEDGLRLPEGADDPQYWGPRLDEWYRQRRRPTDADQQENPVTGGMTRLHPHSELMRLARRRSRLLREYLVPPAEKILPLAERELLLWQQLGAAGHDVTDEVKRLGRQITELRATLPPAGAGPVPDRPAEQDWQVRARVRLRRAVRTGGSGTPRTADAGEELVMVMRSRAGQDVALYLWQSEDPAASALLCDSTDVQVLEVLGEVSPWPGENVQLVTAAMRADQVPDQAPAGALPPPLTSHRANLPAVDDKVADARSTALAAVVSAGAARGCRSAGRGPRRQR